MYGARRSREITRMRDSPSVALVVGLAIIAAVAYVAFTRQAFDYGADPAMYAGLARAIVSGEGYWFNGRPHTLYPPGYPLLLAPVSLIASHSFAALAIFTAILAAVAVLVTAWYCRLRLGRYWPLPVLVLVLSAGYLAQATAGVASEAPYLAASLAFLACVERLIGADRPAPRGFVVAAPVLLVAAMSIRGVGLALLVATAITLVTLVVSRRTTDPASRPRARAALLLSVVTGTAYYAGWSLWTREMRQPIYSGEYWDSYIAQLMMVDPRRPDLGTATIWDVVQRVPQGLVNQAAHAAELLTNVGWFLPVWYLAPLLIVLTCGALGVGVEVRRRNPILGWYLAGYTALLAIWPFDEGRRFMLPVLPLTAIVVAQGAMLWWRSVLARRRWTYALLTVVSVCGIAGTLIAARGARALSRQEQLSLLAWAAVGSVPLMASRRWRGDMAAAPSPRMLAVGLVAFAAIGARSTAATVSARLDRSTIGRNEPVRQASEWLRRNAQPDVVVMTSSFAGVHYATGLRTVPFPVTSDPERLRQGFGQLHPDILLVESSRSYEYFRPTQEERLGIIRTNRIIPLQEIATFEGARLYRVADGEANRTAVSDSP